MNLLKNYLRLIRPMVLKVNYEIQKGGRGWSAPDFKNWMQTSIDTASQTYYGQPAMFMGEGGSIPLISMLGRRFENAQFVITGVLGPHSNAHGPNEFLHLPMVKRLSSCLALILFDQSQRGK